MHTNIATLFIICLVFLAPSAAADEASVRKALQSRFPQDKVVSVIKTPYFGLYEVVIGNQLVYTDERVTYLFVGSVLDAKSLQDLTEQRVRKMNAAQFDTLPLDLAMKTVRGNGSRVMAMFSDPRCPFCKRLEKTMTEVTDVTIYTFLYPILKGSEPLAKAVWCAPDRQKAWDDLMLRDIAPQQVPVCDTPIDKVLALGQKLRVNATPTMIFGSGRIVSGAIPAAEIEVHLNEARAAK